MTFQPKSIGERRFASPFPFRHLHFGIADGTIAFAVREPTLFSVCGLAVLIWGCPKRQTAPRVVYLPSPPSATEQPSTSANGSLIIQEPSPPEPAEDEVIPKEQLPEEKPAPRRRRTVTPSAPETTEDSATPPPVEVPALEQLESPAQRTELRQQITATQAGIQGRMAQVKQRGLSGQERKTLEDAQMFLEQSRRALEGNDLVRALNLARKASLLVNALEGKP